MTYRLLSSLLFIISASILVSGCQQGASTARYGRACANATECAADLICLTDYPDGYCSEACEEDAHCPGGLCAQGACLIFCQSGADCREGYVCVHASERKGCAPSGESFGGIGDNCDSDDDCQTELSCTLMAAGGAQCTRSCASVLECGLNAVCIGDLCQRTCTGDSDCDDAQSCAQTSEGRICLPIRPPSELGGPCTADGECQSGLFCDDSSPGGYCTQECSSLAPCPGDGVCHAGYCFTGCQAGGEALDVIFVVDDSRGMEDFSPQLSAAVGDFVNGLDTGGIDFRLGVVTTDVDLGGFSVGSCADRGGLLQTNVGAGCEAPSDPWITPDNVANPAESLACIVDALGTEGCGFEQPLEALQRALSNAVNPGFIRSTARLLVVMVTNEDDCSAQDPELFNDQAAEYGDFISFRCFEHGIACDGTNDNLTNCRTMSIGDGGALYPISRYVAQIEAVKNGLDNATVAVIAGPDSPVSVGNDVNGSFVNPSCSGGAPAALPAVRLTEFVDAVQGSHFSLCSNIFGNAFATLLGGITGSAACRSGYECLAVDGGGICEPQ